VADARIGASSRGFAGEARGDEAGAFEVIGLEPGDYVLTAVAGSLAGRTPVPVTVGLASRVDGVVIEVDSGRTLSGRVRRSNGGAPGGIDVRLLDLGSQGRTAAQLRDDARTGAGGAYRFEGLLPGSYFVRVSTRGLSGRGRRAQILDADVTGVDLEAGEAAVVTGAVLDPQGQPVPDAVVAAFVADDRANTKGASTRSDETGHYQLDDLDSGELSLEAAHPTRGHVQQAAGKLAPGERREVTLRLERGVRIHGHVRWQDSSPAVGVLITSGGNRQEVATNGVTDGSGAYDVGPFPPGALVYLRIEDAAEWKGNGGDRNWKMVRIGSADVEGIDFRLPRPDARIAGLVLGPDDRPLPGAVVSTRPGRPGQRAVTGEDGAFAIDALVTGSYTLQAEHSGLPPAVLEEVTAPREDVRLRMPAGALLAGTVRRADGGRATPYTIWAAPSGRAEERTAVRQWVHAADGAFELRGLEPGTYDLGAATGDGATGGLPRITVAAGQTRRGLEIRVGEGVALVGRVVDLETQQPLAGVTVHVESEDREQDTTSDAGGAFRAEGLLRGVRAQVALSRPGYGSNNDDPLVPITGSTVDIGTLPLLAERPKSNANGRIGIVFGRNPDGDIVIQDAPEKLPAGKAGLRSGDLIVTIEGRPVHRASLQAAIDLVAGEPGAPLALDVRSPGAAPRRVRIVRM
jgi:protocatechuate 3,4-dioxygenase beta subunit